MELNGNKWKQKALKVSTCFHCRTFLARSDKGISLEKEVKTEVKNRPAHVSGKTGEVKMRKVCDLTRAGSATNSKLFAYAYAQTRGFPVITDQLRGLLGSALRPLKCIVLD